MRTRRADLVVGLCWVAALGTLLLVTTLLGILVIRGGRTLGPDLIFGDAPCFEALTGQHPVFEGLWPALAGTLALIVVTCALAIPLGLAAGVHLSEYASRRWRTPVSLAVDVLASVPSIVMGLFGFSVIILLRRSLAPEANTCLLLAAACLALLVLPYIIRTTQNALAALPPSLRLVGPTLGLSRLQTIRHILIPAASRGILGGIILAIGRAAEDTAVIMLTGVVASAGLTRGLFEKFEALPFRIFVIAAEHRDQAELAPGFGAALVLLLLTAASFIVATRLQRGLERRWSR